LEEVQFKTESLEEIQLKPQVNGGLEEVQFKTESLNEVQLKPQENEARPIVSPNVKVIKISADQGTLNMINK